MQGIALQDMLEEAEYWEGNKIGVQRIYFLLTKRIYFPRKTQTKHTLESLRYALEREQ